jgi:hypothetical protein
MTEQRYSKKEGLNRMQRLLIGQPVPQDDPDTVPGDLLSENQALSDIVELMGDSLPNQTFTLPQAVQRAIGNSGFVRGWGGGRNIFVAPNHANASDANSGYDANNPLQTITQGISLARADRGDTIFVLQNDGWQYGSGLTATITEAVTIPADKPGLRLLGCGAGSMGVNWEAGVTGTFCLTINAIDTIVEGFNFWGTTTNCHGILCHWSGGGPGGTYGENVVINNCIFTDGIEIGIQLLYSWYGKIINCYFDECNAYGIYVDQAEGDIANTQILSNWFYDCDVAMYLADADYCLIQGNKIHKMTALVSGSATDEGLVIENGGSENLVIDNYFTCPLINWANFCSASGDDMWSNNYLSDQVVYTNPD